MRVRRTLMFVNGYDTNKLMRAIESNVDCIVLELEDLCPPHMKEAARNGAVNALRNIDFKGKERIVRINDPRTLLGKLDLEAILPEHPDALRLPKCDTVDYISYVDREISLAEKKYGFEENSIEIIIVIENPLGVKNLYDLACCSPRVTGITLGAGDLTSSMGVERDLTPGSLQLLYVKQKLIMASKLAGIQAHDTTVSSQDPNDPNLEEFIIKDTMNDKIMGFTGRSVSMFNHIDIINNIYAPTDEEFNLSKKLISGYREAIERGETGDVWIDGHFVDKPVIEMAEQKIKLYEAIHSRSTKRERRRTL